MASRKARQWLREQGIILSRPHTKLELSNFSAGTGSGRYTMPYHVVRMDDRYGDSKKTVHWAKTLTEARETAQAMRLSHDETDSARGGAEHMRHRRFQYYIRDIRDGKIYK